MANPLWFQVIQAASLGFGSLAAMAAAGKFHLDRNAARKLQQEDNDRKAREVSARQEANDIADRDLSWRKMEAAQKMLESMSADEGYAAATLMLDWTRREYTVGEERVEITQSMMLNALRTNDTKFNSTEVFIRDSFDTLFYFLERTQHQIKIGMIDIKYVVFPLRYYAFRIDENRAVFHEYLDAYTFAGAKGLIKRLLKVKGPIPIPLADACPPPSDRG